MIPVVPIDPQRALELSRLATGISTAVVLLLAAATELVDGAPRWLEAAPPVGLIGLVSPAIGHHLYEWLRQRIAADAPRDARAGAFLRAHFAALAVTETAALAGLLVFALSGRIVALTGVLMHVILAGALWPTRERMDAFLEGAP